MTDIGVFTTAVQAEDLSWDLSNPDVPYVEGGTLDVSLFTAAQHYPNGYIPSGTVLGKVTTGGLLGPYLGTETDGRETAVGILRASVQVLQPNGVAKTKVGCAVLKAFGVVDPARLPFTSTNAADGGYIDAAGKADLPKIHFTA
ncbi:MAG TPA: head decoration protein [Actinomycetales bacterium]|nr:head decoration protein [Actinomycetales bacterium]